MSRLAEWIAALQQARHYSEQQADNPANEGSTRTFHAGAAFGLSQAEVALTSLYIEQQLELTPAGGYRHDA